MSINIQSKSDYSYLFQSLGSSSSNLNFLADYASIKNGSYGKLMKAYYSDTKSDEVKSIAKDKTTTTTAEETKALATVQTTTDALKESADKLLETGEESVFQGDTLSEEAYTAVAAFVSDYNEVLDASGDVSNTSVQSRTNNLINSTTANKSRLEDLGITINKDSSLSIDKETFMNADLSKVKSLFQGAGSYSYRVSAQSSLINYAADNAASKASTYTSAGTYGNSYNTGSIFESLF